MWSGASRGDQVVMRRSDDGCRRVQKFEVHIAQNTIADLDHVCDTLSFASLQISAGALILAQQQDAVYQTASWWSK